MSRRTLQALAALSLAWIVVNVAPPILAYGKLRSQAVGIVRDFYRVREAALAYREEHGAWPEEEPGGRLPPDLGARLQGEVRFRRGEVVYDWENWIREDGSLRYPDRGVSVGLSLRSDDERLIRLVERVYGTSLPRRGGGVTFPIESR